MPLNIFNDYEVGGGGSYDPIQIVNVLADTFGLSVINNVLTSSKNFFAPKIISNPGTIKIGNIDISGANSTLGVVNTTTNARSLMVGATYDVNGDVQLKSYKLSPLEVVPRQTDFSEVQPTSPYVFSFVIPDSVIRTSLFLIPSEEGVINIESRDIHGNLVTDIQPYTFTAQDVGNEVEIPMSNHTVYEKDEVGQFRLTGAKVKGKTIDGHFVPYFKVREYRVLGRPKIFTNDDVEALVKPITDSITSLTQEVNTLSESVAYKTFPTLLSDANLAIASGIYSVDITTQNIPSGALETYVTSAKLRVTSQNSYYLIQELLVTDWETSNNIVKPIFYRAKDASNWSAWQAIAVDSKVVHKTENEIISGVKTFNSFPVTPSSNPTSNYEVTNKKYVDDSLLLKANDNTVVKLTGNQTIDGIKTFGSFPITPSSNPITAYQVTNKNYVDAQDTSLGTRLSLLENPDRIVVTKTANLTVGTTSSIIDFNSVITSVGLTNSSGVITVANTGAYIVGLSLYVNQSAKPVVWTYIEHKPISTGVWTVYRNQGFNTKFLGDGGVYYTLAGTGFFNQNDQIRISIIRVGGAAALESSTITVGGTSITQYPALLSMYKV